MGHLIKILLLATATCFNFFERIDVSGELKAGNSVKFYVVVENGEPPYRHAVNLSGYSFDGDTLRADLPVYLDAGVYDAVDTVRDARGCVYIAEYRFFIEDTTTLPAPVIVNTVTPK